MTKIVMLPLDERPCNYIYPQLMPEADYLLRLPPRERMGDKKVPADTAWLGEWLLRECADADACILSLDTLVYGGIVPSRLHGESFETLAARADLVRELRRVNPKMKLYLFQLIMRCPDYSLSDEEPDYYDEFGKELHLFGRYTHLEKLGKLTQEEEEAFVRLKREIPADVLADFTGRREKNLCVLLHDLEFLRDGTADYFIVPQDDAAVYGFTSMNQITVRQFLKEHALHGKTAMYPSADDTGLILLGRAVAEAHGVRPRVYVHYASSKAGAVIPWFEDRPLDETVKYHILAAGGRRVYSLPEADIVLGINMGSGMCDPDSPEAVLHLDVERNLAEFVAFLRYALEEGKTVAVGDVATCNGSDGELLHLMREEGLLLAVHAYAGWNTSSNTLGTAMCQSVLWLCGGDERGRVRFLLHRYYEDMGYMGIVRKEVTEQVLPVLGLDYFHTDGKAGAVASAVRERLIARMRERFPELAARVEDVSVEMPWRRMFEAEIRLTEKERTP